MSKPLMFLGSLLVFQIATEAVTFTVNSCDDFWRTRHRLEVLTNTTNSYVNSTIMRFKLTACHFF